MFLKKADMGRIGDSDAYRQAIGGLESEVMKHAHCESCGFDAVVMEVVRRQHIERWAPHFLNNGKPVIVVHISHSSKVLYPAREPLAAILVRLLQHLSAQAEPARLGHESRARLTQIMNLLNVAPDIQEELLCTPVRQSERELKERTYAKS